MTVQLSRGSSAGITVNREHWEAVAQIHLRHGGYERRIRAGESTLHSIELAELAPEVKGKHLVHLQCHCGADTISWWRAGAAEVVGVDFSGSAIAAARALAAELAAPATFVECDVYQAADRLGRTFDVVFSSYGALCWLPEIDPWADVVARLLAPGGVFYTVEFHPFCWALSDAATPENIAVGYPYLPHEDGISFASGTDYLDPTAATPRHFTWNHGLGPIVTALCKRGLVIEELNEFPYCASAIAPMLKRRDDGWFVIPGTDAFPLSYSLRARRPR
jgi:SAM-dependent methyltransferase